MRNFRAPFAIVCLTLAGHALWGQGMPNANPYPASATIMANQADVYSGPGPAFYPTSRLKYGERIVVLGESKKQPGWLEIVPPPGSFSWIDAKYVKTVAGVDRIGIVETTDPKGAPVMPGSTLVNKEPNVEIARVLTGTQLLLLDRPTTSGAINWYPVVPASTEVRFLPADAVRSGGAYAGNSSYSQPYGQTIPTGWQPTAGAVTGNSFVQLAQDGDQALASGNPDRARLLYVDALSQTNDPAWRNYLNSKLAVIAQQSAAVSPVQTGSSPAPWNAVPPPPGTAPFGQAPTAPPAPPPVANPKQWSPWGVLRDAPFTSKDGQPMYVLEKRENGSPLFYVTTPPGNSLKGYVGQIVAVYGTLATRNDEYIRMQYIIAENVATPPVGAK